MLVTNKYNHWLPKLFKAGAVTIGNTIYYAINNPPLWLRVHEEVHVVQYDEHGVLGYLFKYVSDYIKNRFKGMKHQEAYRNIPFEIEAFAAQAKIPNSPQ